MDPNEFESAESFINIKDLFYVVLKKIGIIIVAGIVFGGILFAFKFSQKTKKVNVLDVTTKMNEKETDVQFELRKQNVDRAKDIYNALETVKVQIDYQREYVNNSLYMQIDSENEYESTAQILLTLEQADSAGMDLALFGAYEQDIRSCKFLNEYVEKKNYKMDYVQELITFSSRAADESVIILDGSTAKTGSLYIKVYGPTEEFTEEITALIIKEVERKYFDLNETIAPHSIRVVGIHNICKVDWNTRDTQAAQIAKLESLQKQVASYTDSLDNVAIKLELESGEDILNYYDAVKKAEAEGVPLVYSTTKVSLKTRLKPAIKLGAIGFCGGAFLICCFIVLVYIFGKKFSSQAQFFGMFPTLKKIGVVKPSGKRTKFAEAIDIRSENDSKMSAENNNKMIRANFENLTKGMNKVLITGTGDLKATEKAVKELGLKGDFKHDIFSNPDILKSVPEYDGVVIVEQRKRSLFKDVSNEIDLINNGGAEVIGAIII